MKTCRSAPTASLEHDGGACEGRYQTTTQGQTPFLLNDCPMWYHSHKTRKLQARHDKARAAMNTAVDECGDKDQHWWDVTWIRILDHYHATQEALWKSQEIDRSAWIT